MTSSLPVRSVGVTRQLLRPLSARFRCLSSTTSTPVYRRPASLSATIRLQQSTAVRSFSTASPGKSEAGTASPAVTVERVPSNKLYDTPAEALKASGLKDGQTLSARLSSHITTLTGEWAAC